MHLYVLVVWQLKIVILVRRGFQRDKWSKQSSVYFTWTKRLSLNQKNLILKDFVNQVSRNSFLPISILFYREIIIVCSMRLEIFAKWQTFSPTKSLSLSILIRRGSIRNLSKFTRIWNFTNTLFEKDWKVINYFREKTSWLFLVKSIIFQSENLRWSFFLWIRS